MERTKQWSHYLFLYEGGSEWSREILIQHENALGMAAAHARRPHRTNNNNTTQRVASAGRWWNSMDWWTCSIWSERNCWNGIPMTYLQRSRYCNGFDGCHWWHSHRGWMRKSSTEMKIGPTLNSIDSIITVCFPRFQFLSLGLWMRMP